MIQIYDTTEFNKIAPSHRQIVFKAAKKLENIIHTMDNFSTYTNNNPAIHDSYGNYYVYKYITKGYSVRLLYKYVIEHDLLVIYMYHFKQGEKDNSKYIEKFESFIKNMEKEI